MNTEAHSLEYTAALLQSAWHNAVAALPGHMWHGQDSGVVVAESVTITGMRDHAREAHAAALDAGLLLQQPALRSRREIVAWARLAVCDIVQFAAGLGIDAKDGEIAEATG